MAHLYNNTSVKERRRILRNNQTDSEGLLWYYLRNKRMKGERFHRQYSVGPYILDFYCATKRLAIEVDGSQHYDKDNVEYDKKRTEYLAQHHIVVLRFTNLDIFTNTTSVCKVIHSRLERL